MIHDKEQSEEKWHNMKISKISRKSVKSTQQPEIYSSTDEKDT